MIMARKEMRKGQNADTVKKKSKSNTFYENRYIVKYHPC